MTSKWFLLCQRMCVSDEVTLLSNSKSRNFKKLCYASQIWLIWPKSLKVHN